MKAWDYDAVTHDGAVYCNECVPKGVDRDECFPIFASSEWDYFPVCDRCNYVHDYVSLTEFGEQEYAKYLEEVNQRQNQRRGE